MQLDQMTKAELAPLFEQATGKPLTKKITKGQAIAAIEATQAEQSKEAERPKKKRRPSTKDVLRALFAEKHEWERDALVAAVKAKGVEVTRQTVSTMLSDLQNPKYADGPVLKFEREGEVVRLAA